MRQFLLVMLFVGLFAGSASAWYDTKFDTVVVKWDNGNLKEHFTRFAYMGNEHGFRPHGQYSSYYENGQLKEQGMYRWNVKIGSWISWNEDGARILEMTHVDGAISGQYIQYHPNSGVKTFGHYKGNQKTGLWLFFKTPQDRHNDNLSVDSVLFFQDDSVVVVAERNFKRVHENLTYYNANLDLWIEWKRGNGMNPLTNFPYYWIGRKVDGKKVGLWHKRNAAGAIIEVGGYGDG